MSGEAVCLSMYKFRSGKRVKTMNEHKEFLNKVKENVFIRNKIKTTPTNLIQIS